VGAACGAGTGGDKGGRDGAGCEHVTMIDVERRRRLRPPPSPSHARGGGHQSFIWRGFLALVVALPVLCLLSPTYAGAQDIDATALRIERKLLCPQCTNLRLDVCDTQFCADMRAEIRSRLERGESEQQIIDSFTDLYGLEVLADVPRRGFNLLLFGWVGASLLAVAAFGMLVLRRLRHTATPRLAALDARDEQWLDEQLASRQDAR
jgi:cytochrome c-type biogenesis protein CcmH/NrfF